MALTGGLLLAAGPGVAAAQSACSNPGGLTFTRRAAYAAPAAERAVGVLLQAERAPKAPPDRRAECLPIALRYNNVGVLKTPAAGPWPGQIDKDAKGHAVFRTVEDGVAAWFTWIRRRHAAGVRTPFRIMSMYAPPDDCVGSVNKLQNGQCPQPPGWNPTALYAERVAAAAGVAIDHPLELDGRRCAVRETTLKPLLREIMTFEVGVGFCNRRCDVEPAVIDRAADRVWGPCH